VEKWLWPDATGGSRDDWRGMDTWLVAKLKSAPKPLAIFAWNDYDATHVLNACRLAELKVPDEVAILGVDNNPVICEHQSVNLSSIAHDHERIGYTAAATLERLMCGGEPTRRITRIKPRGVVARESTETFAVYDKDLMPAIDFIKRNLARPLGAAQIAAALKMPRIRLDRMFAAKLGHSAGAEIARRRVAEAKRLLSRTSLSLSEIASRCGYCHASFFIRSFKKATGLTPNAWRKR
jgi:LacI family transcriptional regulator